MEGMLLWVGGIYVALKGFENLRGKLWRQDAKGQATMLVAPLCSRLGSGMYRRSDIVEGKVMERRCEG